MNIKQLIEELKKYDETREVVIHNWNGEVSIFHGLTMSCNPTANTTNLLVLIDTTTIKPKLVKE